MKRCFLVGSALLLAATLNGNGAPVLSQGGVVNAASYTNSIARGAFITIFGTELAAQTVTAAAPYPTTQGLGGSAVNITPVGGSPIAAYVYYVSPLQINAILPSKVPEGQADVTVTTAAGTSAPARITVVHSQFGIFTVNQAGTGPAIVQNFVSATNTPLNGLSYALHDGGTGILWGTGVGPINGDDDNNPQPGNFASSVQLFVGGKPATVLYAGRSGYPGEDQINFTLPQGPSPDSCYDVIQVVISGTTSNAATLSKAASDSKACPSPLGLAPSVLTSLDAGGTATIGLFVIAKTDFHGTFQGQNLDFRSQAVSGSFAHYTSPELFSLASTSNLIPNTPVNTCRINSLTVKVDPSNPMGAAGALIPKLATNTITALDAGMPLVLSGGGKSANIPFANGAYFASLSTSGIPGLPNQADFLAPGAWNLVGPGGRDVSEFQALFNLPTPLAVPNPPANIVRGQPLTLNWTGGGTGAQDYVVITGFSAVPETANPNLYDVAVFYCTSSASSGDFTIPAADTQPLSVTTSSPNASGFLFLTTVSPSSSTPFNARLRSGGSVDSSTIIYNDTVGISLPVI
jgi:uncharacterized protein (TIGR03437 family)